MTIREELTEAVGRILNMSKSRPTEDIAEELVEMWYESRTAWVEKLIERSEVDLDLLEFLVEKYPDGDENE